MTGRVRRDRAKANACRRARENYDILLESVDIGALNNVIRLGLGRRIAGGAAHERIFIVTTLGWRRIPVIYDDRYNCISTVLPPTARDVLSAGIQL